eukprot:8272714-Pyramimonas_sp.AAC.1
MRLKLLKKPMGLRPPVVLRNNATISSFSAEGLLPRTFMVFTIPSMTSRAPSESWEKCLGWYPSTAVVNVLNFDEIL